MQNLQIKPSCKGCLWRQGAPKLSHFVLTTQAVGPERQPSTSTARLRGSKQYQQQTAQAQQAGAAESAVSQSKNEVSDQLMSYGDDDTAKQESQMLAALQEAQHSPRPPPSDTDVKHTSKQSSKAATKPHPLQVSAGKAVSKADMLAKISQAKAYKQEKAAKPEVAPEIIPVQSATAANQTQQLQSTDPQRKDAFSASQRAESQSQPEESHPEPVSESDGRGSAGQAAGYLQQAVKAADSTKGMRMETYSALKEQEKRSQKVEIISVDKNYNTKTKVMDPNYNPKVATWGVFERPANISEAYGGGRTIQAGSPLENAAATQARKERMAAALARFKQDAGTQVEPAVQQACEEAFDEGEQRFRDKMVAAALTKYAVAAELMPIKTELGGRARLQKAICLDSLGQNKEAYAVYSLLERHPNAAVAKQAKRMIFGFRAMDNLKAHTMSYSVTKDAYDKYFNAVSSDWNSAYVSNNEDTTEFDKVIIIASAVMLLPLAFLAYKILA